MKDLERRLSELGTALAVDDGDDLVRRVLTRLDETGAQGTTGGRRRAESTGTLLRVAAIVIVLVAATIAVPATRRAVADWFGLDGVEIVRVPDLSVPADGRSPTPDTGRNDTDDERVRVDELDGLLVSKTLGDETGIVRVDVGGLPGLWIDGEPHLVTYLTADGEAVSERFAGNTLLWQDGDVIRRAEGFATVQEAIAFAREHSASTPPGTD